MKIVYARIPYNQYLVIKRLAEEVYSQSISEYIKDALEGRIQCDLDDYVTIGKSFKETAERLMEWGIDGNVNGKGNISIGQ
ncbi:MAG: hypothetical protein L0H53_00810 [Candidatus Nitrosocosmicus sp.]|nr:hypothetical protein [Candidatus Nitrosocosmicus sp.]MDN5865958.1 hypothetical protein [Candidatus Nitrosocosmicus sp.]